MANQRPLSRKERDEVNQALQNYIANQKRAGRAVDQAHLSRLRRQLEGTQVGSPPDPNRPTGLTA